MNTYHVRLTKVSDPAVVIQGLLAEAGEDFAPAMEIGAKSLEAINSGQRGRIVIPSLHHGSGQRMARDPNRYFSSSGFQTDVPGVIRGIGNTAITTLSTDATIASPTTNKQRGAIFSIPGLDSILITPQAIFTRATLGGAWTLEHTLNTSGFYGATPVRFTGSYAIWGNRIFFGVEHATTRVPEQVVRRNSAGVYLEGGMFTASFLSVVGSRLFRMVAGTGAVGRSDFAWTDQTGTDSPVWSTTYSYPSQRYVMDVANISGQFIAALGASDMTGEVITMSIAGEFTNVLPEGIGSTQPIMFTPYLSGQALLLSGSPRFIYFEDVLNVDVINIAGEAPGDTNPSFVESLAQNIAAGGVSAAGAHGVDEQLYLAVRAKDSANAYLTLAKPHEDGLGQHLIGLLPTIGYVQSLRVRRTSTGRLIAEGSIQDNGTNVLRYYQMDLWDGGVVPALTANSQISLLTSRYMGDILSTKRFSAIRVARWVGKTGALGQQVLTVGILLDESDVIVESFNISANGPALYLPTSAVIGRAIGLEFLTPRNVASQYPTFLEFPVEIDYYGLPRQKDTVRLGLKAGSLQVTRTGTFTKQSRADTLDLVSSAIQTPEAWTLKWWDGRDDWTVVPINQDSKEVEEQARPGEGAAVVWLTVERL